MLGCEYRLVTFSHDSDSTQFFGGHYDRLATKRMRGLNSYWAPFRDVTLATYSENQAKYGRAGEIYQCTRCTIRNIKHV